MLKIATLSDICLNCLSLKQKRLFHSFHVSQHSLAQIRTTYYSGKLYFFLFNYVCVSSGALGGRSWSCRRLWPTQAGCWESNSSPLRAQPAPQVLSRLSSLLYSCPPPTPGLRRGSPYVVQAGLKFSTDHADLRLRSNLLSQPLKRWHERCVSLCLAAIAL